MLDRDAAATGIALDIAAMIAATLDSADGQWVLQKREQAEAELVLSTADEKRVATHIVDRTFVENDERWVIDYKSARLDAIDGLARYAEQYRPQLERYAGLFTREGRPVRKAVFFLAHGKLVEL